MSKVTPIKWQSQDMSLPGVFSNKLYGFLQSELNKEEGRIRKHQNRTRPC